MKLIGLKFNLFLAYYLIWVLIACESVHETDELILDASWSFFATDSSYFGNMTMPASVHTALYDNGLIKDPFLNDHEIQLQWIENKEWIFDCHFQMDSSRLIKDKHELILENIDLFADIYLNNEYIGSCRNYFVSYVFDISRYIQVENHLRIVFKNTKKTAKELRKNLRRKFVNSSDSSEISHLLRKPAYQFGWDWGPRLISNAIDKVPMIRSWSDIRIRDHDYKTTILSNDSFDLEIITNLESLSKKQVSMTWKSAYFNFNQIVTLDSGIQTLRKKIALKNARLWTLSSNNKSSIIPVQIVIISQGKLLQSELTIAFREIRLNQSKDSIGENFAFELNGSPIFIKGANLLPLHYFPSRISDNDYRQLFNDLKLAGINMVRVWGGASYESERFYQLADAFGIMVWQDFPFANSLYPIDLLRSFDLDLELEQAIKRLRKHPSLALFCGNNEIDVAWKNWGWQHLYIEKERIRMDSLYEAFFKQELAIKIDSLANEIPYVHTSPLSNWGQIENFNQGSMHYWGVWHGTDSLIAVTRYVPRFMAEFGVQSYPSFQSLTQFATDSNLRSLISHQKSYKTSAIIDSMIKIEFKILPDDLAQKSYLSQLMQANYLKNGIEIQRKKRTHCNGTMFWQWNDVWPAISWSVIDFYQEKKAGFFAVQSAYNNELIICERNDSVLNITLIADEKKEYDVRIRSLFLNREKTESYINFSAKKSGETIRFSLTSMRDDEIYVCELYYDDELLDREIVIKNRLDSMVLPMAKLQMEFYEEHDKLYLKILSDNLMLKAYFYSDNKRIQFKTNYIDILPDTETYIEIIADNPQISAIKVLSLNHIF